MIKPEKEKKNILIPEKILENNTVFLGDREILFNSVKKQIEKNYGNIDFFEVEKLNISVDDIRRMIRFVSRTSEGIKIVLLSSFYWAHEAQNAMLKVLEETAPSTYIFLFGLSEKNFIPTVLSRVQKQNFSGINRYIDDAREVLSINANERLENKKVKKILSLKVSDYNFEKNVENEKKDREAHILFLRALVFVLLENKTKLNLHKNYLEKILEISILSEIEGGSPHLFLEWLLLSAPKI